MSSGMIFWRLCSSLFKRSAICFNFSSVSFKILRYQLYEYYIKLQFIISYSNPFSVLHKSKGKILLYWELSQILQINFKGSWLYLVTLFISVTFNFVGKCVFICFNDLEFIPPCFCLYLWPWTLCGDFVSVTFNYLWWLCIISDFELSVVTLN